VQYLFENGKEVPVFLPPHGNAKNLLLLTIGLKKVH